MGHIDWILIEEKPAELRDGCDVLLWVDDRATVGYWDRYPDGMDWATYEQMRPIPTYIAELNRPLQP